MTVPADLLFEALKKLTNYTFIDLFIANLGFDDDSLNLLIRIRGLYD